MDLAQRWWLVLLRGFAAILFGVLAFMAPAIGLLMLVILFGAYAIADGVFNLSAGFAGARSGRRWGALIVEGILSLAAGVLAFVWPGITAIALLWVIAFWAVATGIAEIAAAIRLRRMIRDEWLLVATGLLSIAFGVILFARPGAGALALVLWIGAYAIVFGGLLVGLSFRLRSLAHAHRRPAPTRGVPAPA